jgi:hypothetical protein
MEERGNKKEKKEKEKWSSTLLMGNPVTTRHLYWMLPPRRFWRHQGRQLLDIGGCRICHYNVVGPSTRECVFFTCKLSFPLPLILVSYCIRTHQSISNFNLPRSKPFYFNLVSNYLITLQFKS